MATTTTTNSQPASGRYLNGVLTLIAALLALHLLRGTVGTPQPSEALAQRAVTPESFGVPNASDQRARMIKVLEDMGAKLQSLQQRLDKGGFEVKVTAMPKVELAQ